MAQKHFLFDLEQRVSIKNTLLYGTVCGLSAYSDGTPRQYWVSYVNKNGELVRNWFHEYDLQEV